MEWSGEVESQVLAAVMSRRTQVISWETVRMAGMSDKVYSGLLHAVGHDGTSDLWYTLLLEYRRYRAEYTTIDGVVLFRGRIVIPEVLRAEVLSALNRAHQGTTGMGLTAQDSVWWPRFTKDLESIRNECVSCRRNAPSQPALPPVRPPSPDYPFQLVSTDYFSYGGKNYLVVVDRYSGWPVIRL